MKPKIFTLGGATFDIFVQAEDQSIITFETPESKKKWFAFPHGAKVRVKEVLETFGGGAANTAVMFAGMNFETYFVGLIGQEEDGDKVLKNLNLKGVNCRYVKKTSKDRTGFSNIINTFDGDRNLLYYPGANQLFSVKDLPLEALKSADWIYLSHMAKKNSKVPHKILELLKAHPKIKLAWNPGHQQIKQGMEEWAQLLKRTEVLFLNKEEAAEFTHLPYELARNKHEDPRRHEEISFLPAYADASLRALKALHKKGPKYVVITDGRHGVQASDGKNNYFCPVISQKRVDTLGAGDGFASGTTSALMTGLPLQTALIYGTINAGSVVNQPGAQKGLLGEKEMKKILKKTKIEVKIMQA